MDRRVGFVAFEVKIGYFFTLRFSDIVGWMRENGLNFMHEWRIGEGYEHLGWLWRPELGRVPCGWVCMVYK
ncbi:MAG TPA: hypothetical protein EYP19_10125 [Desulfobacterales bacterium]|nr:hypothetical protein [Desulfobacterales bacterium]